MINLMTDLQKNNMEFGLPSSLPFYATLVEQMGGSIYSPSLKSVTLDLPETMEAFKLWTRFYTDYNLSLAYNFVNRFRTGEMPIALADYSTFNSITLYAPEIQGKWAVAMIPGTEMDDGTLNRAVVAAGMCTLIFKQTDSVEAAWEYVKWWCGGEAQTQYATEIEAKLGQAARVPVANQAAFSNVPWSAAMREVITAQWQEVRGMPEAPGGYYLNRHMDNAFRAVVYKGEDYRDTLLHYMKTINEEIRFKRREFGLSIEEE